MAIQQANRSLQITTPFGKDVLLLAKLAGAEHLSQLYSYQLALFSEAGDPDPDKILGKDVTVQVKLPSGGSHASLPRLRHASSRRATTIGACTIPSRRCVPWLWFLTRSADCRIFQKKSVARHLRGSRQALWLHRLQAQDHRQLPTRWTTASSIARRISISSAGCSSRKASATTSSTPTAATR